MKKLETILTSEKWDNKHVSIDEIKRWIISSWREAKEIIGPIKVFRSNDWGITALFKIVFNEGFEKEIVCKVGFLKIFETSADIYNLLKETVPKSVPNIIKSQFIDGKTWLQFEVFKEKSIDEVNKLQSLIEIAKKMSEIQVRTSEFIKKNKSSISVINIESIMDLFEVLLHRYLKKWIEEGENISKDLNMSLEVYNSIFNEKSIEELKKKVKDLCEELSEFNIPYSIDHVDLHSGNAAILENGEMLIYDWEEAVFSCPFFSIDKLLDEAAKLEGVQEVSSNGLWTKNEIFIRDNYLLAFNDLENNKKYRAFDAAMCIAPIKYAYQGTFFLKQVGWHEIAPVLIAESIAKAYRRCNLI